MRKLPPIALAAWVATLLSVGMPNAQAKQQCSAATPSNAHGRWWSYRLIDGRKCWYEGKPMLSKSLLEWPRRHPQPFPTEVTSSHKEAWHSIGLASLGTEDSDTFEARWRGRWELWRCPKEISAPGSRRAIRRLAKSACFQSAQQTGNANGCNFQSFTRLTWLFAREDSGTGLACLSHSSEQIRAQARLGEEPLDAGNFNKGDPWLASTPRCSIARAKSLNLPNARFECADFLQASFEGYDVIAAIECVYYLSLQEQGALLEKVAKEHSGKIFLLSGPIVDYRRHFSHRRLMHEFTTRVRSPQIL